MTQSTLLSGFSALRVLTIHGVMHMCVCVYVCMYIYIHIHAPTHTYHLTHIQGLDFLLA